MNLPPLKQQHIDNDI